MWGWVVVWLLIVLVGAGWLFLLGREVVRKGLRLATDVQVAAERATAAPPDGSSDRLTDTSSSEQRRVR